MGDTSINNPYADWAGAIAKDLYKDTKGARHGVQEMAADIFGGRFDPTESPVYQRQDVFPIGARAIHDQFGRARSNMLQNLPRGGGLTSSLGDLEMGRASDLADLQYQDAIRDAQQKSAISQDVLNKAYGVGSMAPQQSLSGFTNLAGSQAASQAQEQAGKMGALGDLGGGIGMILGNILPPIG